MTLAIWVAPILTMAGVLAADGPDQQSAPSGIVLVGHIGNAEHVVDAAVPQSHPVVVHEGVPCETCETYDVYAAPRQNPLRKLLYCDEEPCAPKKRGLLDRLRGMFRKHEEYPCECIVTTPCEEVITVSPVPEPEPIIEVQPEPQPLPKEIEEPDTEVQQTSIKPVPQPKLEPDHGEDYGWLQGRLQFAHVYGGAWVLRYSPLDQTDEYGGSVVLTRNSKLDRFREGDFVRVDGEILSTRPTHFLGGALYRVDHITMLEAMPRN